MTVLANITGLLIKFQEITCRDSVRMVKILPWPLLPQSDLRLRAGNLDANTVQCAYSENHTKDLSLQELGTILSEGKFLQYS